jgi:hypothetical protein
MWKSKNRILLEQIDFLRAQVAQLQNYVLMSGAAPIEVPRPGSDGPSSAWDGAPLKDIGAEAQRMYSTELEEDIEYQLQEGIIGEAEAKRLLTEAGAIADDIELM